MLFFLFSYLPLVGWLERRPTQKLFISYCIFWPRSTYSLVWFGCWLLLGQVRNILSLRFRYAARCAPSSGMWLIEEINFSFSYLFPVFGCWWNGYGGNICHTRYLFFESSLPRFRRSTSLDSGGLFDVWCQRRMLIAHRRLFYLWFHPPSPC